MSSFSHLKVALGNEFLSTCLVRVDIMYLGDRMVVYEFESLEAFYTTTDSRDSEANVFLNSFWHETLDSCISSFVSNVVV